MNKLYRFKWNCGRMGDVEGLFVENENLVAEKIGSELYFGEILGKHSEVFGTLSEEDLVGVSEDQDFIDRLVELLGYSISGFNPLDYIEEDEEI